MLPPPPNMVTPVKETPETELLVTTDSTDIMTPPTPTPKKRSGELTIHEFGFILDSTLKPKHRKDPVLLAFIDSFIRCKSVSQAASENGLSYHTGYSIRHRMDVANCIQKLIDKSAVKYGFDASEIMERTKEIVDFDPIQIQNADGSFKSNLHDIAPEARRNIKKLRVKNLYNQVEDINGIARKIIIGEVIEYEFYDKLKAVELTGKEKEMFKNTTRVEHTVTKDMASILLEASRRGSVASVTYANKDVIDATVVESDNDDGE